MKKSTKKKQRAPCHPATPPSCHPEVTLETFSFPLTGRQERDTGTDREEEQEKQSPTEGCKSDRLPVFLQQQPRPQDGTVNRTAPGPGAVTPHSLSHDDIL